MLGTCTYKFKFDIDIDMYSCCKIFMSIQFLETKSEIADFLTNVKSVVERSVEMYIERNFTHLMVSFGCTGGQHRSVYSADTLAKHLEKKYGVTIVLHHIEQEIKNWINEL